MFAPAALTAALFLGPLALLAVDTLEQRQRRGQRRDEVHIMSQKFRWRLHAEYGPAHRPKHLWKRLVSCRGAAHNRL